MMMNIRNVAKLLLLFSLSRLTAAANETNATTPGSACDQFLAGISPALPSGITGCECQADYYSIQCHQCDFTISSQTGLMVPTARLTQTGGMFEVCANLTNPANPTFCMTVAFAPTQIEDSTCNATYDDQDCDGCGIQFCQGGGFGNNQFGFAVNCSNVEGGEDESTCDDIDVSIPFSVSLHAVYEAENHQLECKAVSDASENNETQSPDTEPEAEENSGGSSATSWLVFYNAKASAVVGALMTVAFYM